jgi:hypothetical protein
MGYKAATQIRGGEKGNVFIFERGEAVKKSDFDSEEEWDALVAAKAVMADADYALAFPEQKAAVNQAAGTPSNLEQVEGTTLQAAEQEEGPVQEPEKVLNPADPPKVEKAGTAEGFDTKGATNKTKAENVKGPEDAAK